MRMPSLRLNAPQNTVFPESKPLRTWLDEIMYLTKEYGEDMVLYVVSEEPVTFKLSTHANFSMDLEQTSIPDDVEMTLKQWKEGLKKLIHKYSEETLLYPTTEGKTLVFYISPIKRD